MKVFPEEEISPSQIKSSKSLSDHASLSQVKVADQDEEEDEPLQTAFSQQKIPVWRPLFTPIIVTVILLSLGFFFLFLGIIVFVLQSNLVEMTQRYDNICSSGSSCTLTFQVESTIPGPVFLYYKLTNFYQNHRRYAFSRNDDQLQGKYVTGKSLTDCEPFVHNTLGTSDANIMAPSGAIARSFFTDTFTVSPPVFSEVGICFSSDREKLFRSQNSQYVDRWLLSPTVILPSETMDEHFIVWMRTASLPTFMKLYARCPDDLLPGTYTVTIQDHYSTSLFHGEKYVVISNAGTIGGKNRSICIFSLVIGSIMLLFAVVIVISNTFWPRKLGDLTYLIPDT